jgi:hypothetical protein
VECTDDSAERAKQLVDAMFEGSEFRRYAIAEYAEVLLDKLAWIAEHFRRGADAVREHRRSHRVAFREHEPESFWIDAIWIERTQALLHMLNDVRVRKRPERTTPSGISTASSRYPDWQCTVSSLARHAGDVERLSTRAPDLCATKTRK